MLRVWGHLHSRMTSVRSTVPNAPRTPMRTIRISDDLWQALIAAAAKSGESASDVLRRAAEEYVRERSTEEDRIREAVADALLDAAGAGEGWIVDRSREIRGGGDWRPDHKRKP